MTFRVGKAEASVTSLPRAHSLAFPLSRESRKLTTPTQPRGDRDVDRAEPPVQRQSVLAGAGIAGSLDLDDITSRGTRGSRYSPIGFGELMFHELLSGLALGIGRCRTQQRRDDDLAGHLGEAIERLPLDRRKMREARVLQDHAGTVSTQYLTHRALGLGLGRGKDYKVQPGITGQVCPLLAYTVRCEEARRDSAD
jgi:hypothetical protein